VLKGVLAELQLSTSDLIKPQAALRVGRMLAASPRTETTITAATEAAPVEALEAFDRPVHSLARSLWHQFRLAYPLPGRITQITPQGAVFINIGVPHGVTAGMMIPVFGSAEPLQLERPIGQVVTQVATARSQAQALKVVLPLQRDGGSRRY
jgi:hypothetical protein